MCYYFKHKETNDNAKLISITEKWVQTLRQQQAEELSQASLSDSYQTTE